MPGLRACLLHGVKRFRYVFAPESACLSRMPVEEALERLEDVDDAVDDPEAQEGLDEVRAILNRLPGSEYIRKYTGQDMAEAAIGATVFSLPLLVEDGVFVIAEWFLSRSVGPVPVFFTLNAFAVMFLAGFLLYATDIREVKIWRPILGFIPRRFVGVLSISFLVAAGMLFMWGRLSEGAPSGLEQLSRVTVVWAAAALGAVLADILPGESKGQDLSEILG